VLAIEDPAVVAAVVQSVAGWEPLIHRRMLVTALPGQSRPPPPLDIARGIRHGQAAICATRHPSAHSPKEV
jgi:hypothetical protein